MSLGKVSLHDFFVIYFQLVISQELLETQVNVDNVRPLAIQMSLRIRLCIMLWICSPAGFKSASEALERSLLAA